MTHLAQSARPLPCRGLRARFAALLLSTVALPGWAIVGGTDTSNFQVVGNGVQFTANWVVTARHLGLAPGGTFTNGYGSSSIAAVYHAPGSGIFPENDLSLLRLDSAIAAAPTIGLSSTWLGDMTGLNIAATMVTDHPQVPRGYAFSHIREAAAQIDADDNPLTPDVTANYFILHNDTFTAPHTEGGDSGGGLFLGHVTDQTSPLLGIGSAIITDVLGQGVGFASAYVQLAAYRSWIDDVMASDLSDTQTALWVSTPIPEPAAWALYLAGLAGVAAAAQPRRRSAARRAANGV